MCQVGQLNSTASNSWSLGHTNT